MQPSHQDKTIKPKSVEMSNSDVLPKVFALLNEGHTVTLPLRGFSMRPFLENNRDKALLAKPTGDVKVGEPVLAEVTPGVYVLHRVVAIDGEKVTLLGDGNLKPEHCTLADIHASVVGFYRKGRTKLDRIDGRKWRIYSFLWMRLRPVRRWLLAIYRRVKAI